MARSALIQLLKDFRTLLLAIHAESHKGKFERCERCAESLALLAEAKQEIKALADA